MGFALKKKYEREVRFEHEAMLEVVVKFTCNLGNGSVSERAIQVEVPVMLYVKYYSGEKETLDHPGCEPEVEVLGARYKGGYPEGKDRWLALALQGAGSKVDNLGLPSMSIVDAAPVLNVPATGDDMIEMVFEQWPDLEEDILETGLDWVDWEKEEGR